MSRKWSCKRESRMGVASGVVNVSCEWESRVELRMGVANGSLEWSHENIKILGRI